MKTSTVLFLIFVAISSKAFATAQAPDRIIYNGKEYYLHTNPMEPYFAKNPEKKPKSELSSTALWRGYIATFEIKADRLLLKDIEIYEQKETEKGRYEPITKSVKDSIFPNNEELLIDWFTGILVLPYGELVHYVHMGYGSTYSNYILLQIKKGKLTGKRTFDNKQYEKFKKKQYRAYKKTNAYKEIAKKLKKDYNWTQKNLDKFLHRFVIDYTSEFLDEEK